MGPGYTMLRPCKKTLDYHEELRPCVDSSGIIWALSSRLSDLR